MVVLESFNCTCHAIVSYFFIKNVLMWSGGIVNQGCTFPRAQNMHVHNFSQLSHVDNNIGHLLLHRHQVQVLLFHKTD